MSEQEIDSLLDKNIEIAFEYFEKVTQEGSSKDNGDTPRILGSLQETND